jgi:hypothetical protein
MEYLAGKSMLYCKVDGDKSTEEVVHVIAVHEDLSEVTIYIPSLCRERNTLIHRLKPFNAEGFNTFHSVDPFNKGFENSIPVKPSNKGFEDIFSNSKEEIPNDRSNIIENHNLLDELKAISSQLKDNSDTIFKMNREIQALRIEIESLKKRKNREIYHPGYF